MPMDLKTCDTITLRGVVDEDFVNYKKASMFLGTAFCDWKCCREIGVAPSACQNHQTVTSSKARAIPIESLCRRYLQNPITSAVVFGGLEPFLQTEEVLAFVRTLRGMGCEDDIVIYTGYEPNEVSKPLELLRNYPNIVVKFGRYRPNSDGVFDPTLGVHLASSNQHAEKIS